MNSIRSVPDNFIPLFIAQETRFLRTFHELLTPLFHESSEEHALLSNPPPPFETLANAATREEFVERRTALLDLYRRVLNIQYPNINDCFHASSLISSSENENKRLLKCGVKILEYMMREITGNPIANRGIGLRLANRLSKIECVSSQNPFTQFMCTLISQGKKDWVFILLETQKKQLLTPPLMAAVVGSFFLAEDYEAMNRAFAQLESREDREEVIKLIREEFEHEQAFTEFTSKLSPDLKDS